ncbi:MAG TPA: hypothetical protein VLA47_01905 [Nitrospira sp.]|nr:hypothetical protein [Nitrospira sp.]
MLGIWAGCGAPDREFDLVSFHSSTDQRFIARYYHEEALRYRQQADELDSRGEMYERMFGPDSDWVAGARILAQSYRLAADDRERLAQEHLYAGRNARHSASALRPQASTERTP